jgi:hypothetical protein
MKKGLLDIATRIILENKCTRLCEIGTHRGKTAVQLIDFCCKNFPGKIISYEGFDVFDYAWNNEEFNRKEVNGKNGAKYGLVKRDIMHYEKKYRNLKVKLHRGFTHETLKYKKYDFVYIDGGHSYDTVKHDYEKVKDSKVILFDDCQEPTVFKFTEELRQNGIDIQYIDTGTPHKWGLIINN